MKKRKKKRNFVVSAFPIEYHFKIVWTDYFSMRILITKNDIPYCQFNTELGKFLNPNHIGVKIMPNAEKIELWNFINDFGRDVDGFSLLCN